MNFDLQTNIRQIMDQFDTIKKETPNKMKEAVTECCLIVEREAKESFTTGTHTQPHPGTPPHIDTGDYRASITHQVNELIPGEVYEGLVGTDLKPYPEILEFGWSGCPAGYPLLNPAFNRHHDEIVERIRRAQND